MKDKEPSKLFNLKLVDFKEKKEEAEKLPEFFIKKMEIAVEQAKKGNLKGVVFHFDFFEGVEVDDESDKVYGGELLWNHNRNAAELIGTIEIMKALAMGSVFGSEE